MSAATDCGTECKGKHKGPARRNFETAIVVLWKTYRATVKLFVETNRDRKSTVG